MGAYLREGPLPRLARGGRGHRAIYGLRRAGRDGVSRLECLRIYLRRGSGSHPWDAFCAWDVACGSVGLGSMAPYMSSPFLSRRGSGIFHGSLLSSCRAAARHHRVRCRGLPQIMGVATSQHLVLSVRPGKLSKLPNRGIDSAAPTSTPTC